MAKLKNRKRAYKVVLTGGHAATAAIATIEELQRRNYKNIYWIGYEKAIEGSKIPTLEANVLPQMGVVCKSLITGRLQRKLTLWTLPSLLKIPFGFIHAAIILKNISPNVILSFGGFAGFPVVVAGWLLKIPVVIHEQTESVGRANKFSSYFAEKILVARKSSLKYFPRYKTYVVGNPVATRILKVSPKIKIGSPPVIFITGGSRGSQFINSLIEKIIEDLLKDFLIIHQTGFLDFEKFEKLKYDLPEIKGKRYRVYDMISPQDMDKIYKETDIVVARAGANTVSEIIIVKRPTIFIPLLISYKDEQFQNALRAKKFGIAEILYQEEVNAEKLFKEIYKIKSNWEKIVLAVANKTSKDLDSSVKVVNVLEDILA